MGDHVICGIIVDNNPVGMATGCGDRTKSTVTRHPLTSCICLTVTLAVSLPLIIFSATAGRLYLEADQQAVLHQRHQPRRVVSGPGFIKFNPWDTKAEVRDAILLSELSYVHVSDSLNGSRHAVAGPGLFFPGTRSAG